MSEDVTSSRAKRSGPPTYAGSLRESKNIREFGRCQHLGEPAKRRLGVGVRGALVSWLDQPLSEGWATGIEPATSGTTIRRSNQLSYAHHQCKLGLKTKGKQEARKACFLAYSRPWRARGLLKKWVITFCTSDAPVTMPTLHVSSMSIVTTNPPPQIRQYPHFRHRNIEAHGPDRALGGPFPRKWEHLGIFWQNEGPSAKCRGAKNRCRYWTRPAGLEPATYGLEVRCSIQLSYGRLRRVDPF